MGERRSTAGTLKLERTMTFNRASIIISILVCTAAVLWVQKRHLAGLIDQNIRWRVATEQARKDLVLGHASVAEAEAQRLKDQTELARLEQLQPAGGAGGLAGASEQGIANRGNAANSAGYVSLSKTNLHELRLK